MFALGRHFKIPCNGLRSVVSQRHHVLLAGQYRAKRNPDWTAIGKRLKSSDVGLPETGHIEAGPNEGILFFDRKSYPSKQALYYNC